jgi:hypothetical protein
MRCSKCGKMLMKRENHGFIIGGHWEDYFFNICRRCGYACNDDKKTVNP